MEDDVMTRKLVLLALAATLWAAGASAWWLEEGRPSFSPDGETIIFHSNMGGVYTMTADGQGIIRLVGYDDVDAGSPRNPVYSPDGEKVAFATEYASWDNRCDIYICDKDGSNVTRLTAFYPDDDTSGPPAHTPSKKPFFSPDGTKILFTHTQDDNSRSWVYTVNVDGTGLTRLSDEDAYDVNPAFSPDGEKIVYTSYGSTTPPPYEPENFKHSDSDIYIMNADGSGKTRLTDGEADYNYPSFSPDGNLITYVGVRYVDAEDDEEATVFILDTSNWKAEQISKGRGRFNFAGVEYPPIFPPGGGKIAYWVKGTPDRGFYIEDLASGEKVLVEHVDGAYSFSADGEKIVFVNRDECTYVIEIVNSDGTGKIETSQYYPEFEYSPEEAVEYLEEADEYSCEEVDAYMEKAIENSPEEAVVYLEKAAEYLYKPVEQTPEEVAECLVKCFEFSPEDAVEYLKDAVEYSPEEAVESLEEAIEYLEEAIDYSSTK
jgi:Tol biopolymer transport system component